MPRGQADDRLTVAVEDAVEAFVDPWDALADRLAAAPFLRPGWILAWAEAFAHAPLRLLTARRRADLVGVLPFIERRGVVFAPVNWHTPLFGLLARDRGVGAALAEALLARAPVRADLSFIDRHDPRLQECLAAAERNRRPFILREVMRSPYVSIAGSDWEAYRASLSRKFRKELGRCRRRLEEQGPVTVELLDGTAELERSLELGFALEASGWKDARGSAIVSDPQTHRFYSAVARWARDRGWLTLAFLRLGRRPIAFDLCLESDEVTYVLKGGFDPAFRRFGPGMLLTYATLQSAFERGRRSYEFLGADAPYKLAWTGAVRELMRFQAFGRSPLGRINYLAWSRGREAVLRTRRLARTGPRAGA